MELRFINDSELQGARAEMVTSEFDPYHQWLGILPEEQPPHLYRLLELTPFENDPGVIEAAIHRQLAHLTTCERGEHAGLVNELKREVHQAELFLLDLRAKAEHDELLREYFARTVTVASPVVEAEAELKRVEQPEAVEPLWLEESLLEVEPASRPQPVPAEDMLQMIAVRFLRGKGFLSPRMFLYNLLLGPLLCVGVIAAWWLFAPETFPTQLTKLTEILAPKIPKAPQR